MFRQSPRRCRHGFPNGLPCGESCGSTNPEWTEFMAIDEPHIAVHAFEDGGLIPVDVFPYRPFDPEAVHRYVGKLISIFEAESRLLTRTEGSG